jgi:hypothetical protein
MAVAKPREALDVLAGRWLSAVLIPSRRVEDGPAAGA